MRPGIVENGIHVASAVTMQVRRIDPYGGLVSDLSKLSCNPSGIIMRQPRVIDDYASIASAD